MTIESQLDDAAEWEPGDDAPETRLPSPRRRRSFAPSLALAAAAVAALTAVALRPTPPPPTVVAVATPTPVAPPPQPRKTVGAPLPAQRVAHRAEAPRRTPRPKRRSVPAPPVHLATVAVEAPATIVALTPSGGKLIPVAVPLADPDVILVDAVAEAPLPTPENQP